MSKIALLKTIPSLKWGEADILRFLQELQMRLKFGRFTIDATDIGTVTANTMSTCTITGDEVSQLREEMFIHVSCDDLPDGLVALATVAQNAGTGLGELTLKVGNVTAGDIDASAALQWQYFGFNVETEN